MQALVFTSLGVSVNGNRNWLSFGGPFQIQPSELAKLALVLWCVWHARRTFTVDPEERYQQPMSIPTGAAGSMQLRR